MELLDTRLRLPSFPRRREFSLVSDGRDTNARDDARALALIGVDDKRRVTLKSLDSRLRGNDGVLKTRIQSRYSRAGGNPAFYRTAGVRATDVESYL
jgi:hypothetical protein